VSKLKFSLAGAILLAIASIAIADNISQWSTSAASNNSAPPNGFPEGQAPSTLNDAARELMAAVSRWYEDTQGGLVTTGTGNAYVLTTNSSHAALADQSLLSFRADRANTGAATLNVDGLGAKSIQSGGANLGSGEIVQDAIYTVAYNSQNDTYDIVNTLSAAQISTKLGLGSLATASTVNNSDWSGTDLAVANGGTGGSTAGDARTNLGVAIGSDVQAWDEELDDIAGLAVTNNNFIVGNGSAFVAESGATARASMGVSIGSNVQAWDVNLDQFAALAVTDGNFAVGNGSAWVAESGATARSSLGLGSLATLSSISNSNWSGADLAVTNGGTGASDAATARSNLGAAASSHNHSASDITSGTLAVGRGGTGQTTMDNVSEQVTLQWTIQSDPGGTPSGSPGDVFAYY